MTIILGGTGFIGRHLAVKLAQRHAPVVVFTRGPAEDSPLAKIAGVEIRRLGPDRRLRRAQLVQSIRQTDVVYNLAGASGAVASNLEPAASLDGNCPFQLEFLEACAEAGNRPHVVFASSRLVYGRAEALPVDESAPVQPTSFYAAHKLCVESYHRVQAHRDAITYTICRISNPFAFYCPQPGQTYGFISRLIYEGASGRPLNVYGEGSQLRDFLPMEDLLTALVLCGEHAKSRNQILNIGSGQAVSIIDVARLINGITGAPIIYSAWPREDALVESGDFVMDVAKARRLVGYEPTHNVLRTIRTMLEAGRHPPSTQDPVREQRMDKSQVLDSRPGPAGLSMP